MSIALKFLLTIYIGKYYPEESLGGYGLFCTTIASSFCIIGFGFDGYASREIVSRSKPEKYLYIKSTFNFYILSWAIVTPFIFVLTRTSSINFEGFLYYYSILLFETCANVFVVIFNILNKTVISNIVIFICQSCWIVFAILFDLINNHKNQSLEGILLLWLCGAISACIFGLFHLKRTFPKEKVPATNWPWIKSGFSVCYLYFISAIGYKSIEFSDRYFVNIKYGAAKAGVYIFYSQIANLISVGINITVISNLYPSLVESLVNFNLEKYNLVRRKMYQRVALLGSLFFVLVLLFSRFALHLVGKDSFYSDIYVLYILLASNLAMNFSFIPHYCQMGLRQDKLMVLTTLVGSGFSIFAHILTLKFNRYGIVGIALTTCLGFVVIFVLKLYSLKSRIVAV